MNDDVTELDEEQTLEHMTKISEDLGRDKKRFDAMQRKGTLNSVSVLAGELVQTVVPTLHDSFQLTVQLASLQQESVFALEDAVYQQTPRAMHALLELLTQKGIITQTDTDRVIALLATQQVESVLGKSDSDLILEQLNKYIKLLSDVGSPEETAPVQATIDRVVQITAYGDDEEGDEQDEETVETNGTAVEANA